MNSRRVRQILILVLLLVAVALLAWYLGRPQPVPVTLATVSPFTLVVHPSSPAKNVRELIALAKAKPGELNFGSAGNGSVGHYGFRDGADGAIPTRGT